MNFTVKPTQFFLILYVSLKILWNNETKFNSGDALLIYPINNNV